MRAKVSVIGAGFVGTMVAQRIVEKDLADTVLFDIVDGLPQGKALDIAQSSSVEHFDAAITGTNNLADIADSSVIVFTAGFPRTPGMTREELVQKNGTIIKTVTEKIATYAPDSIIIMVTNPLDVMTHLAWKISGFPDSKVIGMGGVLDAARYSLFLAEELGVSVKDINAMVLGSHGETMVPVDSCTTIKGIPVHNLLSMEKLAVIIDRTKKGGAEIVNLLKKGSAWHAPSASAALMVEAILHDNKQIMPAAAHLTGQYGITGIHIGVPVKLGAAGVEKILELDLSKQELASLQQSAAIVKEMFNMLQLS